MPGVIQREAFRWELPTRGNEAMCYAGSIPVEQSQMDAAAADARARIQAARVGEFRRFVRTDAVQWKKEIKGCLAERVAAPLMELCALGECEVRLAEFVDDKPVRESDIDIGGSRWDVKACADAIPDIQTRNDRYFAVNKDQLERYEREGYDGLMFVRLVNEAKEADIWYVPLAEVKKAPLRAPVSENVTPWYALDIPKTIGSVLPNA